MNPTPAIYVLQSLHGHLSGIHRLIFCLKTIKVAADLISLGIIFQIPSFFTVMFCANIVGHKYFPDIIHTVPS